MKYRLTSSLFLCALCCSFGEKTSAMDGVVSTFSVPPFSEDATVAGIDGWTIISSGNPDFTTVRSFGDSRTGLLLRTYGIQKELKEPMDGQVTVTLVMQFGFVAEKGTGSQFVAMPMIGVGVGSAPFGFSNADVSSEEPGGFYYVEKSLGQDGSLIQKNVYLLPRTAIFEGAKYTLAMAMDLDNRTYVLTISGIDSDGKPIELKSGEVAMDPPERISSGKQFLTGIRLASGLPSNTELFVESVSMAPTPQ